MYYIGYHLSHSYLKFKLVHIIIDMSSLILFKNEINTFVLYTFEKLFLL